jgi:hypothetical protein
VRLTFSETRAWVLVRVKGHARRLAMKSRLTKFQRENVRRHREWEDSLEGIHYCLNVWGDASLGTEKATYLIVRTLATLPRRVRNKVLERVIFVVFAGGQFGTGAIYEFKESARVPIIFLNFTGMQRRSQRYQMSTVAHEIAHYILGHFDYSQRSTNAERKADDLTEKWGFEGAYKSYKPLMGK